MKRLILALLLISSISVYSQPINLQVKAFSQGFYNDATGKMVAIADPVNFPSICDTASIVIIDSTSGQSVFCDKSPFSIQGFGNSTLPSFIFGNSYLVGVRFRNTLHVVSKNTILFDSLDKFVDLTLPSMLCCSFDSTYGVATAYSGDVNDDGTIDGSDVAMVYNDNANFVTGYVVTDINGDGMVDQLDINIVDNNANLSLFDNYYALCSTTGIRNQEHSKLSIEAFPNPFSGEFFLSFQETQKDFEVKIFDTLGKTCFSKTFHDEWRVQIETNLPGSGIYFLQVIAGQKKSMIKLISF